jgi:inner membrane protein
MTWWAWAILGIVFTVIDVHLTHDFTLFCVGVAAFGVAAVAGLLPGLPLWSHWLVFALLSIAVLIGVRQPLLGRFHSRRGINTDFDYLLGEVATPCNDLAPNAVGQAELRGSVWTVRNSQPSPVGKNQRCRVTRVEGLTLWIKAE